MILLSHMHEWIIELDRVVDAYEATVDEIEELIDQLEQDPGNEDDLLIRTRQECQRRQQLELVVALRWRGAAPGQHQHVSSRELDPSAILKREA